MFQIFPILVVLYTLVVHIPRNGQTSWTIKKNTHCAKKSICLSSWTFLAEWVLSLTWSISFRRLWRPVKVTFWGLQCLDIIVLELLRHSLVHVRICNIGIKYPVINPFINSYIYIIPLITNMSWSKTTLNKHNKQTANKWKL